ncbi:MAG: nucleotide exchange factor GrpE [Bacteroidaceae bacterium]|nr:nucleotide exchange factor GrpE [Bacteroidaceae bacterium]
MSKNTEDSKKLEGTEDVTIEEGMSHEDAEQAESPEVETPQEETLEDKLAAAEQRIQELEKERLYKQAEFDNYRKRIIKEKADLILNGGRKVLEAMLPVIDDLERALQHMQKAEDVEAVKQGVELIHTKFLSVMKAQGVTQMETEGADFNTDYHEAVTQFPAPSDELKGKVIDCTEKGYLLNDTVLRYAKVVVGI